MCIYSDLSVVLLFIQIVYLFVLAYRSESESDAEDWVEKIRRGQSPIY